MEENILDSIKILLGIQPDDFNFDQEIIMHINSTFTVLNQIGVGPTTAFKITSNSEDWDDFLTTSVDLEAVKSYIFLKVRMLFDPPQNSFLVDSIEKQIREFEWRLQVQSDPYSLTLENAERDKKEI